MRDNETEATVGWRERVRNFLDRHFPDRELMLRTEGRVSYLRISQNFQVGVSALAIAAIGWTAYASVEWVVHDELLATKENEIAGARLAYSSLLGEVAEYQQKFTTLSSDLEENHAVMLGLLEQNTKLQKNLQNVESELEVTKDERSRVTSARENLKTQLREIEDRMHSLASRNFTLKDNLSSIESDLQTALAERNEALFESSRMRRTIRKLETRLTDLQDSQEEAVQRLSDRTSTTIEQLEKIIQIAGLDVDNLPGIGEGGQGGPFIAAKANRDGLPAEDLKANLVALDTRITRWQNLQQTMRRLPLAPPMKTYYITSKFGKRRDPVNKRWASHYGLDLGAPKRSPIYAPSPGVVSFAGWKGRYGKLIEIDHGGGIKTRYGHLHKILVKKGEKVDFRKKIGLLGNTGRSTGAHLHYEVAFNGKNLDPMKFMKAGLHVFQE